MRNVGASDHINNPRTDLPTKTFFLVTDLPTYSYQSNFPAKGYERTGGSVIPPPFVPRPTSITGVDVVELL